MLSRSTTCIERNYRRLRRSFCSCGNRIFPLKEAKTGLQRARSLVSELSLRINRVKRQIDQEKSINSDSLQMEEIEAAGSVKQRCDPPDISGRCDDCTSGNRKEDSRSAELLNCEDGKDDRVTRNHVENDDMEDGEVIYGLMALSLFSYVNYPLDDFKCNVCCRSRESWRWSFSLSIYNPLFLLVHLSQLIAGGTVHW